MVSDRDKLLTSHVWKEFFRLFRVNLEFSTTYHPQTDGQTECVNQCLEMYLQCTVGDSPKIWKSWPTQAEFWYNSTYHFALGCSPFTALYGHEPFLGIPALVSSDTALVVADFIADQQLHTELLKDHLAEAQARMKVTAHCQRIDVHFQVGDKVFLKLQPYAQSSLINRPYPKLAKKYYGPHNSTEDWECCLSSGFTSV